MLGIFGLGLGVSPWHVGGEYLGGESMKSEEE